MLNYRVLNSVMKGYDFEIFKKMNFNFLAFLFSISFEETTKIFFHKKYLL
jgi:hypothetical protein